MKREHFIWVVVVIVIFFVLLFLRPPKKSFMEANNGDEIVLKVHDRTYVINKLWKLNLS